MSEEFIPTLTHATERDIDLLLVEELFASAAFVDWMAQRAGVTQRVIKARVLHSKRRTKNRREIDIFLDLLIGEKERCALLIENKLDASEQPDQAESYRDELARLAPDYPGARMMIVCPKAYASEHDEFTRKFDAIVTYEELALYFDEATRLCANYDLACRLADEASARAQFRHDILHQAIYKHRRGNTPIPNELVGDFNARYVALLAKIAPDISPGKSMLKPANPDESTSMIFDHLASLTGLPPDLLPTRFAHELGRGQVHRANYVAVTFGGWGRALPILKEVIERDLVALNVTVSAKSPTKARPNPGLTVACPTPPVDNQKDFAQQERLLITGMQQATTLRDWLSNNILAVRNWKMLADYNQPS